MTATQAIDAALRSYLAAGGNRSTHADAAALVGENANAWRAYLRGARSPTTGKLDAWIANAHAEFGIGLTLMSVDGEWRGEAVVTSRPRAEAPGPKTSAETSACSRTARLPREIDDDCPACLGDGYVDCPVGDNFRPMCAVCDGSGKRLATVEK